MKKYFLYIAAAAFLMAACTQNPPEALEEPEEMAGVIITMTTLASEVSFDVLAGSGNIIFNWGDGETSNMDDASYDASSGLLRFSHSYARTAEHQITVIDLNAESSTKGSTPKNSDADSDDGIYVDFAQNQLTTIDLSGCSDWWVLNCAHNQLTSLDLTNLTKLGYVFCQDNQLTASALNDLFRTLHSNAFPLIKYDDNPGEFDCDFSIAEEKGWHHFRESGKPPPTNWD